MKIKLRLEKKSVVGVDLIGEIVGGTKKFPP